jgi:hypothetical protein
MKKKTKAVKSIFTPEQQKANLAYAKSKAVKKGCPAVREAKRWLGAIPKKGEGGLYSDVFVCMILRKIIEASDEA